MSWKEVTTAKDENRHEIKLSGVEISKKIEETGLDKGLFDLTGLNLLTISETSLKDIPDDISRLINLQSLLLFGNKLENFSESITKLSKLKVLDLSRNCLTTIPESINLLSELMNINLSSNKLESFPKLHNMPNLITFNVSNNKLASFLELDDVNLPHLSDIKLNGNEISEIPQIISKFLPTLKNLDLGDNQIKQVPGELAQMPKLKELNLKGNKLADKRLMKLVDQCQTKQVLNYVREHCKVSAKQNTGSGSKKGKKAQKGDAASVEDQEVETLCHSLTVFHFEDDTPNVIIKEELVKDVRPFILCCILKDLSFDEEQFKKFIQLQTKLHDTICDKRNQATIATHDLDKIAKGNLIYTAKSPSKLKLTPLTRIKDYTGEELVNQLRTEAENLRKEKKRNVYSGIHKYLYLLEGKQLYPCLADSSKKVISFPPITNSDITKMSVNTTNMFLEVTSQISTNVCKTILDKTIEEFLLLGIGKTDDDKYHSMKVQQVKVVDLEGNLKAVYPSRTDFVFEGDSIKVVRPKK